MITKQRGNGGRLIKKWQSNAWMGEEETTNLSWGTWQKSDRTDTGASLWMNCLCNHF